MQVIGTVKRVVVVVILCVVVCVVVCVLGCSRNVPLTGKVTYTDGTPITVGMVIFTTDTMLARGTIKSDGTYKLGTESEVNGVPRGTYKVYISGADEPTGTTTPSSVDSTGTITPGMAVTRQLVGREYQSASTTPLTCDIPAKDNRFDIQIEKPAHIK